MKKALLLLAITFFSTTLLAFPAVKISIFLNAVRIGNDSINVNEKFEFLPVKKQETPIQGVANLNGYEIGFSISVKGYGVDKKYKEFGIVTKGWFMTQKIYYRKPGETWILLTTYETTQPESIYPTILTSTRGSSNEEATITSSFGYSETILATRVK